MDANVSLILQYNYANSLIQAQKPLFTTDRMKEGMPLPMMGGVSFQNPEIQLGSVSASGRRDHHLVCIVFLFLWPKLNICSSLRFRQSTWNAFCTKTLACLLHIQTGEHWTRTLLFEDQYRCSTFIAFYIVSSLGHTTDHSVGFCCYCSFMQKQSSR